MKKLTVILLIMISITMLVSCTAKESETMEKITTITTAPTVTTSQTTTVQPTSLPTVTPTPSTTSNTEATAVTEIDYIGKKLVALTFDDGPNTDTTPLVLDKLEKYNVVASFFLVGQNLNEYTKPIVQRQLDLGCEINNHSWSHPNMTTFTPEEIIKQIQDTNDKINEMVGLTPKYFRPPFIATNNDMYDNIDLPFICGIGCNDWDAAVTKEQRVETILGNVKDGDIILLHDASGNFNTVNALDEIIPNLLDDGYAFVTVSKLFELKGVEPNVEYKIWTNVTQ